MPLPPASQAAPDVPRVELFRLLGDAGRLRLLALCSEEELSVGEIAEISGESQPQISKRAALLRQMGLLGGRRDGTRTYLAAAHRADPVVAEALAEGRRLCLEDGSLDRVAAIVAAREAPTVGFFDEDGAAGEPAVVEREPNLAHLAALAPLLPARRLAVDVGTGDGALLEVLAPLYERVIAVDRSPAQLARAARRVRERSLTGVRLFSGRYDDAELLRQVDELSGADLVYASRVLHHASRPAEAMKAFARLLARGGHVIVLDYLPHDDERLREQADVWLGFSAEDLARFAGEAGLDVIWSLRGPDSWHAAGPDSHLHWHALCARKRRGDER